MNRAPPTADKERVAGGGDVIVYTMSSGLATKICAATIDFCSQDQLLPSTP